MSADGTGVRPWLGLVPYSEEDKELFHGREQDSADLLRLVRREVLTVLFGRSGTGKSSLLKAGLFPKLREEKCLPVWIRLEHSGKSGYAAQIVTAVRQAAESHGMELELLHESLAGDEGDFWEFLHRVVFWDPKNQPVTPVLVFDQFEEFFTLARRGPEVTEFLEELCGLVENHIPLRVRQRVESGAAKLPAGYGDRAYKVVISLREDFVSRLDDLRKDMPSVMHNRHALKPMTGDQALEVVLKPGGALVDEGVARKIVRFVSEANDTESRPEEMAAAEDFHQLLVEPALLSLVCSELNLQRLHDGKEKITLEQVRTSGDRILDDFYERCLKGMDATDRVFIEDRLVTGGGFRTAVPVEEADACGLSADEVERLIDRRLLRKEERLGIPHIELTHDVLTRVVMRSRQGRREHEQMQALRHKDEAALLEREKAAKERLRETKVRRMRRARWIATAAATVLAVMAIVTYRSAREARSAEEVARKATDKAEARALALKAVDTSQSDPELAVLLAIESAISDLGKDGRGAAAREIELALRRSTRESLIRNRYAGHRAAVYGVEFDADGKRLLTCGASPDSTARIWDVVSGREIATLDHSELPGLQDKGVTVSCARFSPDGKRIVTATYQDGGHVYVWDADPLREASDKHTLRVTVPLGEFAGHDGWVTSVAFLPDGRRVASGGYDNVIRIWDLESFQEIEPPLAGHTMRIRSLVCSRDGRHILSASDDGTARLWDLETAADGVALQPVIFDATEGKRANLHAADLSLAGTRAATAGNDNFLRVWDVATGRQIAAHSHPDGVMGVAFIDDTRLVSVCNDATIRFWELARTVEDDPVSSLYLRLIASQRGHQDWIRAVAVSPDRRFIATGSHDQSVRRWALPQGGEVGVLGGYGRGYYWCADAWPEGDGLKVFVGTGDGRIRALDAWSELEVPAWENGGRGHHGSVRSISLSPDGKRLVSSGEDQTAILWDASDGKALATISGHRGDEGGTIYHARFSPDGKRVVTASNDGTSAVWNVESPAAAELVLTPGDGEYAVRDFENAEGLAAKLLAPGDAVSEWLAAGLTEQDRKSLDGTNRGRLKTTLVRLLNGWVAGKSLRDEPAFRALVPTGKRDWLGRRGGTAVVNRLLLDDAFGEFLKPYRPTIYDARFSADGKRIVTADFQALTATIWDAASGKRLRVLPAEDGPVAGHGDMVVGASFNPDGKHVVTACTDGFCRVWDSNNGTLLAAMPHRVAVRSAEYSPDGKWILTSAADGAARLWSMPDYQPRAELRGHSETSPDARFSSDGRYIISSSRDGTVRICYTDPWDLYALATHRVTRKLTLEELENFKIKRPLSDEERAYYQKQRKEKP